MSDPMDAMLDAAVADDLLDETGCLTPKADALIDAEFGAIDALRVAEDALAIAGSYRAHDQTRIERTLQIVRAALARARGDR